MLICIQYELTIFVIQKLYFGIPTRKNPNKQYSQINLVLSLRWIIAVERHALRDARGRYGDAPSALSPARVNVRKGLIFQLISLDISCNSEKLLSLQNKSWEWMGQRWKREVPHTLPSLLKYFRSRGQIYRQSLFEAALFFWI